MSRMGAVPASAQTDQTLAERYRDIRVLFEHYCAPLQIEDYALQAMPDTSPAKWHLAHTSWFFETFILKPYLSHYQPFDPDFEYLFNSYYNGVGAQFPRAQRGLLSRPTVQQVYDYRHHVDDGMQRLLAAPVAEQEDIAARVKLGLQHEMQHQELFFTDLKYNFAQNPLLPIYCAHDGDWLQPAADTLNWHSFAGGIALAGAENSEHFYFDNETPRHRVFLEPFSLASRPITNLEVLQFIENDGYRTSSLWLADGWALVQQQQWQHPLYWQLCDGTWHEFTLHGLQPLDPHRSACHLSAYEADAIARWMDARLPTEFEWECAAQQQSCQGNFIDSGHLHPLRAREGLFGDIWQWTRSAYSPYPGYRPADGAIGEYNGKFMSNQLVLRGGSCVSDSRQLRASYRNFFYAKDRWQFSGLRLAKDGD